MGWENLGQPDGFLGVFALQRSMSGDQRCPKPHRRPAQNVGMQRVADHDDAGPVHRPQTH